MSEMSTENKNDLKDFILEAVWSMRGMKQDKKAKISKTGAKGLLLLKETEELNTTTIKNLSKRQSRKRMWKVEKSSRTMEALCSNCL
jgi:hypothetical protein